MALGVLAGAAAGAAVGAVAGSPGSIIGAAFGAAVAAGAKYVLGRHHAEHVSVEEELDETLYAGDGSTEAPIPLVHRRSVLMDSGSFPIQPRRREHRVG